MKRIVVVGAGMGGLAAAIDLAVQGLHVTVLDRATAPGGKMRTLEADGATLDAGPTVFTMRWVFESLFAQAGSTLSDHLTLRPAAILARHAWAATAQGPQQLDLHADPARAAEAIGTFAGPQEARGYLAFCKEARRMYRTLEAPFIGAERPSVAGLVARAGVLPASASSRTSCT